MDPLPCPRCHRNDRVEEEDQGGSSSRWFVCERCGTRFSAPPRDVGGDRTNRPGRPRTVMHEDH
jgi:hypothetical protein